MEKIRLSKLPSLFFISTSNAQFTATDSTQQLALLVANYFLTQNINPKQIEVISVGEHQPRASNATTEGRAKNRRVEVLLNFY